MFLLFIIKWQWCEISFFKKVTFSSTMSFALLRVVSHELCPLSTYFLPKFCMKKCIFNEVKFTCQVPCITWAGISWSSILLRKKTRDRLDSKSLLVCGLFWVTLNNCQQFNQTWCCAWWEYPHKRGSVCAFGQWKPRKATAAAASSGIPGAAWASCLCFCPAVGDLCVLLQAKLGPSLSLGLLRGCWSLLSLYGSSDSLQENRTAWLKYLPRICVSSAGGNGL